MRGLEKVTHHENRGQCSCPDLGQIHPRDMTSLSVQNGGIQLRIRYPYHTHRLGSHKYFVLTSHTSEGVNYVYCCEVTCRNGYANASLLITLPAHIVVNQSYFTLIKVITSFSILTLSAYKKS